MRITFQGPSTPARLVSEFSELVIELAEMGVEELDGINIYLGVRVNGETVQVRTRSGGSRVDILTVQGRTVRSYAENDANAPYSAGRASGRGSGR